MFCIERRVSLVLRRDLSRLIVHLYIFIVYEFVVPGCNEGRFEYSDPFYELGFSVFIDRDDSNLKVRPCPPLSSNPQLP